MSLIVLLLSPSLVLATDPFTIISFILGSLLDFNFINIIEDKNRFDKARSGFCQQAIWSDSQH